MKKTANLQDIFLTKARKQGVPLTLCPAEMYPPVEKPP